MSKSQASQPAAKKDLNKLASKTDFKNLRKELLKVETRVENLEDGQKRIETKLDRIENKLDGFAGGVELLKQENSVGVKHTRELRVQLDDHESRLTTLESQ